MVIYRLSKVLATNNKLLMTKKFVRSGKKAINEFIIPDIFENKSRLIGIKTGEIYNYGLICYTGVELDTEKVFAKATKERKIRLFSKAIKKKIIEYYLKQIKEIKIGKLVTLDANFNLIEIAISENDEEC